jgi:hypothetical protein
MPEPAAFPTPPASGRTVAGGTVGAGGVITATTTTVTVTRTVHPLHIGGTAGQLVWAAEVAADRAITSARFRVAAGAARADKTRPGRPASAVLTVDASDAAAVCSIVISCPVGTVLTVTERWAQTPRRDQPVMLADPTFGLPSVNGVTPPAPAAGMPAREAKSSARRSPQVRAAQRQGSLRPDLLPRQNSTL